MISQISCFGDILNISVFRRYLVFWKDIWNLKLSHFTTFLHIATFYMINRTVYSLV